MKRKHESSLETKYGVDIRVRHGDKRKGIGHINANHGQPVDGKSQFAENVSTEALIQLTLKCGYIWRSDKASTIRLALHLPFVVGMAPSGPCHTVNVIIGLTSFEVITAFPENCGHKHNTHNPKCNAYKKRHRKQVPPTLCFNKHVLPDCDKRLACKCGAPVYYFKEENVCKLEKQRLHAFGY